MSSSFTLAASVLGDADDAHFAGVVDDENERDGEQPNIVIVAALVTARVATVPAALANKGRDSTFMTGEDVAVVV